KERHIMNALAEPELILQGGLPVHRQIADQLRHSIALGTLYPGEALPTVRQVAVGLTVHPGAVEQAYVELEKEGWLTWQQGNGPYVAVPPTRENDISDCESLETFCTDILARAERLGFTPDDVIHTLATL